MSDERLRELERCWKETGAAEDGAAFLLERVRAGTLSQRRLELAAYLGSPAAAAAVQERGEDWRAEASRTGAVDCSPLTESGPEANELATRLVLAVARARLEASGSCKKRERKQLAGLLAPLDQWLDDRMGQAAAVAAATTDAMSSVAMIKGDLKHHPLVRIIVALRTAQEGALGAGMVWAQEGPPAAIQGEAQNAISTEVVPWVLATGSA